MATFNKRLLFWLVRAYIKKWRKTILVFFLFGLVFFFVLRFFVFSLIAKIPLVHKEIIGSVGAYTVDTLPSFVLSDVSRGLTGVDKNGNPFPDLAKSWEVKEGGKAYIFHLRHDLTFVDGSPFTSSEVHLSFSDVTIQRPDPYTMVFRLKEIYAPFLVSISRPLFKNGFVGMGKYKITDIKLNGTFVASLTMVRVDDPLQVRLYQFYPTQESLKIAFVLGNVTKAVGLITTTFENRTFETFPNATVEKQTNYSQLATLFYNTQDRVLSDKKLRDALSYAIPDTFSEGLRAGSLLPPSSWAYDAEYARKEDLEHAKILLKDVASQNKNTLPLIQVSVLPIYKNAMKEIAQSWKKIGITTKITIVNSIPFGEYYAFLGDFNMPKDPDQYSLWHSDQQNNITGYKSVRIDKLLEDGRKTIDQGTRVKIYDDFQKYLLDDQPASFLYFPYTYTVTRK